MTVTTIGLRSALSAQTLLDMRTQLDDLGRQLGTGKKSTDYAGLGPDRGLTVGLRSQIAALSSFDNSITQVGVRIQLGQSILTRINDIGSDVKSAATTEPFSTDASGLTTAQTDASTELDEIFGLLNSQAGNQYLFSGKASDQPAVESTDHILNGDGSRAGFQQVAAERLQADLGTDGLGRLVVPAAVGNKVSVSEDAAGSPFGFKLAGATTSIAGATVAGPSGAPKSLSVTLGANPAAGDTVKLSFTLPDGTSENVTLTATTSSPPGANEFSIGANATATATNLQAAVKSAVGTLAGTSLKAASAMAAANDFFNVDDAHPTQRVAGPPFATATALADGTSANTVTWYTGEAGSDSARNTSVARVDPQMTVAYGMRANEEGIRSVVQALAAFSVTTASPTDPNAAAGYAALAQRTTATLASGPGHQQISTIAAELAGAQSTMQAAQDRHQQTSNIAQNLLQSIEGVNPDEVGAQVLALQTNLQATLQMTAMLYKTTLLNYM
jgi:flagellin-like hook-associated protein FlgL